MRMRGSSREWINWISFISKGELSQPGSNIDPRYCFVRACNGAVFVHMYLCTTGVIETGIVQSLLPLVQFSVGIYIYIYILHFIE